MTSENNGMIMPVAPYYGGNGYGNDGGMFGGNWMWFLLIWFAMFGWGNGGWGGNGAGCQNGYGAVQNGFDHQAVMGGINGVQTGVNGIVPALQNGFAQAEIAANNRQMTDMNQNYAIQSALQQCCCDNRAATADLKYTMATEAAQTRANCDANKQAIMDKLCQLELDGVKQNYEAQLRTMQSKLDAANLENQTLKFDASQIRQNSLFQQGLTNEVDALYNRLNNCPVQTIPVYGRQPIFTCGGGNCGCGFNNGFAA